MGKETVKKIAIGTAIAGAAGYVAGILTAPKSGKETRTDIKDAANHGIHEAEKQLKVLHTELNQHLEEAKTKLADLSGKGRKELEKAAAKAGDAKEKARQVLSAVHEGDAQDKELKKAIDEAGKAVEHLRTFLKK